MFKIDPTTGAESVVYAFAGGSDGQSPASTLLSASGALFGTTPGGTSTSFGTVFKVELATGAETVLHAFAGAGAGRSPYAGLIEVGGKLYGTTAGGGTSGLGTVFKIAPISGAETTVHSFARGRDGQHPEAALLDFGGNLYGTTYAGGTSSNGTVFRINLATGAETVVYSFAGGGDGANPYGALIDVGGILYGTTAFGGTSGNGTVFKIHPATKAETVVYSFAGGSDGAYPYAALYKLGRYLYGTTEGGVVGVYGTVFRIDLATGAETVLHGFTGGEGEGEYPVGALISIGDVLYGTTYEGGTYGYGTVFKLTH